MLQPLSLLPFGLDLLFEHHLLQVGRWQQQQKELLRGQQGLLLSAHSTLQLMRTRGTQRAGEGSRGPPPLERATELAKGGPELKKDRQASWWLQLTQSSQVYIQDSPEGARLAHHERKKRAGARLAEAARGPPPREGVVEGAEACPPTEAPLVTERLPAEEAKPPWKPGPSAREENKEKGRPFWMGSPPDAVLAELKRSREQDQATALGKEQPAAHVPSSGQPKWAHLFGSRQAPKEPKQANRHLCPELGWMGGSVARLLRGCSCHLSWQMCWGGPHLEAPRPSQAKLQCSLLPQSDCCLLCRLPSGWLSLDRSVFQLMAQTVGASVWRETETAPKQLPTAKGQPSDGRASPGGKEAGSDCLLRLQGRVGKRPASLACSLFPRAVKALCHHIATEAGQLSFKKGDILRVLGRVDADWLRCSRREGAESGLVPIMYVTHLEDADY
ncbi:hypothetical protein Chor_008071 [Crotalus horridus]